MSLTNFPNGVASYGVPLVGSGAVMPVPPAKVFWVGNDTLEPHVSDGNTGLDPEKPFSTLAAAISATTANRGDVIYVKPGHAETITTTLTPTAGTSIIGLGVGGNRPTFTASGAIDLVTVSADNVRLSNVVLVGASASVTALVDLSGDHARFDNVEFRCPATPVDVVTVSAATNGCIFERCVWRGTADGPDNCIIGEAGEAFNGMIIRDCYADFGTDDLDESFIRSDFQFEGLTIDGLVVLGIGATVVDFNSSTKAIGDGILTRVYAASDAALTIANAVDLGGCVAVEVKVSDSAAARGLLLPTATPD